MFVAWKMPDEDIFHTSLGRVYCMITRKTTEVGPWKGERLDLTAYYSTLIWNVEVLRLAGI